MAKSSQAGKRFLQWRVNGEKCWELKKSPAAFDTGDFLTRNRLRRGRRERLLEVVDHPAGLLNCALLWAISSRENNLNRCHLPLENYSRKSVLSQRSGPLAISQAGDWIRNGRFP